LNDIAPFDWRTFFLTRLNSTDFHAPLGGIERGGWKLTYEISPSGFLKDLEQVRRGVEMGYSIGLRLGEDGSVADVIEGMAAARAGIGPGMKILAVNGKAYSPAVLRDVVRATTDPRQRRIELLIDNEGDVRAFQVMYSEGEKYPVLERDEARPDMLSKIIAPLTWSR
jgi:predicted metalloprotease with PDZ domain